MSVTTFDGAGPYRCTHAENVNAFVAVRVMPPHAIPDAPPPTGSYAQSGGFLNTNLSWRFAE